MAGKRDFYTGSIAIIGDPRPSGLDLRVYACVSMHDGMSLKKGTGRGCYATFATLTAEIGCDASNLSKSLKRLVEWGYLVEERQDDRRRKTYRVVFDFQDSWRNHQQSIVGETANDRPEIVGNGDSGNRRNPPLFDQHYSSLKGLDTLEREKLDSSKEAHLAVRRLGRIEFGDNLGGQLAKLERTLKAGDPIDCPAWIEWIDHIIGNFDDSALVAQAARVAEHVIDAMTAEEYAQWGLDHGWVDDDGKWHCPHPREAA